MAQFLSKIRDRFSFSHIAREVSETCRTPLESGFERYIGLDHIDPESLRIRRWGWIAEDNPTFTKVFRAGQLLFGRRRAYQRKVAIAEFDGVCSGDIIVMEANPDTLVPELLPFIVQSEGFYQHALSTSAGSLSPRTRWSDLARYELALPPLSEQRRIADLLWAAEDAIEAWTSVTMGLHETKSAYLRDYFGIQPEVAVSLGKAGEWLSGGTPSRDRNDYWQGDIPWASPKDMKLDVLNDTQEHVTGEAVQAGSRIVPKDTIFVVTRGMILARTFPVALTGVQMAFNQDIKALIVSDDFVPEFVFYWLQSQSKRILALTSESSHGTKRLPTDDLFRLQVPCMSQAAQYDVVQRLNTLVEQTRLVEIHLAQTVQLKKALLADLI